MSTWTFLWVRQGALEATEQRRAMFWLRITWVAVGTRVETGDWPDYCRQETRVAESGWVPYDTSLWAL